MTPEEIFKQTEELESICVDAELMEFQVACSVQDLQKAAFNDEVKTVEKTRAERPSGNKFHDIVIKEFLADYDKIQKIRRKLPKGYSFPKDPKLMQYYIAHKMNTQPFFGNFSGTGSGKTLSAVFASRQIDAKMTVIVYPNDVVEQWGGNDIKEGNIKEAFPDSIVTKGKDAFSVVRNEKKHQYLVLNYDKFSQVIRPLFRQGKEIAGRRVR